MPIRLLDSGVISRIAAGEVVERPASVVKELVENSLDAGATQISVEIKSGGLGLIRVVDNGSGIPDDQCEIAFQRHATSKIRELEDLQSIHSLGFRGEALPSIAAVAEVQMLTSQQAAPAGTFLELSGGEIISHQAQARAAGTTITVHNIFRNVPARLKFMKSNLAEGGRVAEVVTQYALAYPEVRFVLIVDGKNTLRSPGSGRLIDSVSAVYGAELARQMLPVASEQGPDERDSSILVQGLTGSPALSRSSREWISLFVNRRWISNRTLSFAVEEAYHGLLMQGRHPVAVLNLTVPPDLVDVNVHPAKTEIKFQDERAVFARLQRAVRAALVSSSPVPRIEETRTSYTLPTATFKTPSPPLPDRSREKPSASPDSAAPTPLMSLPLLRVIGQAAATYIVAEGPEGLFIIDQHAAHERIQMEKILGQQEKRNKESQGLLEPVTLEMEPREAAAAQSHLGDLQDLGFEVELFGARTLLVRSIPALLSGADWSSALRESLNSLSTNWREALVETLACHSAIRAGKVLSQMEMQQLLRELEQTSLPNSCPHGRPTIVQIPYSQLEREFGRRV
jgi:DNA mismatch repair protein MutL